MMRVVTWSRHTGHDGADGIAEEEGVEMEGEGDVREETIDDGGQQAVTAHAPELMRPTPCDAYGCEKDSREAKNRLRPPWRPLRQV